MADHPAKNFSNRPAAAGSLKARQGGQTLIETVVATFILTMGITAAVGLAIFALSTATSVSKQIIATGLAREGIEAVKNMRDTNWLKLTAIDLDCYNYSSGGSDARCYKAWLNPGVGGSFNINPNGGNQSYRLGFDSALSEFWQLQAATNNFGLNFDGNVNGVSFKGFYVPNAGSGDGNSDFYRKLILRTDGANIASPFDTNIGPRLQVISQVWWTDKKCPRSQDWPGLGKCSLEMQTFLTNWKNY